MSKPLVILISGPPCTGKTTLGKRIAEELHLPFVHKDGIYDEFQSVLLKGKGDVIEIGGIVYEVDTTDFGAIDYTKLIKTIRKGMKSE